jgi:hypothetical protein
MDAVVAMERMTMVIVVVLVLLVCGCAGDRVRIGGRHLRTKNFAFEQPGNQPLPPSASYIQRKSKHSTFSIIINNINIQYENGRWQ